MLVKYPTNCCLYSTTPQDVLVWVFKDLLILLSVVFLHHMDVVSERDQKKGVRSPGTGLYMVVS